MIQSIKNWWRMRQIAREVYAIHDELEERKAKETRDYDGSSWSVYSSPFSGLRPKTRITQMTPEARAASDDAIERVEKWDNFTANLDERARLRKAWEFGAKWAAQLIDSEIDIALNG